MTQRGLRVLVVDDNADVAESLAVLIGLDGHIATTAADGARAIALARAHLFDVVLLDIGLPDIDGYEVARRLRSDPGGAKLRLVALTGYGRDDDRRLALEAGFDRHLLKPVEPDVLRCLLATWEREPHDQGDTEA